MSDKVNHPEHYRKHPSGVECIQVTEHMGFCLGNAVKYIWRAGHKGSAIEDLKKARWYIDRELARLEPSPSDDHHPATIGAEKLDVLLDENATLERVIRRALYVVRSSVLRVIRRVSCPNRRRSHGRFARRLVGRQDGTKRQRQRRRLSAVLRSRGKP